MRPHLIPGQTITEPLTAGALSAWLRDPPPEDVPDIEALIRAARELAEQMNGRQFVRAQWSASFDAWPRSDYIELRAPLVSVELFRWRDCTGVFHELTQDSDYIVDTAKQPGRVVLAYGKSWPREPLWPSSAIEIQFTDGFAPAEVPETILKGMRSLVTGWYEQRIPWQPSMKFESRELPLAVTACFEYDQLRRF